MSQFLEKILNVWTLLIVNVLIIFAAELTGEGKFFFDTGLIHGIAVVFILLGFSRIYVHYPSYDPVLENLVHCSLAALAVFSLSHVVEFLSYTFTNHSEDSIFANVGNFYIISLLLIILGAEFFIKAHDRKAKPVFFWFLNVMIFFQFFIILLFLMKDNIVSLEPDSPILYAYITATIVFTVLGVLKLKRIEKLVSISKMFVSYLIVALVLIGFSAIQNISYEVLEQALHFPQFQIIYLSHFTFYIALSLMFLAFTHFQNLSGVYKDAVKEG